VSISAPDGSYNPDPRKFSFLIKSAPQSRGGITVADNGTARSVTIR
jgi:hypothetical protein